MTRCTEFESLINEELDHKIQYTDEWNRMTDDERDAVSYDEEEQYFADPKAEEDYENEMRTKKGNHLKTCDNVYCRDIYKIWLEHENLKQFVEVKE